MAPTINPTPLAALSSLVSMFAVPMFATRDSAWHDGRCTPHRKRHGKTAKNRAKAKAARDARKR
jgi:hypothetical protein